MAKQSSSKLVILKVARGVTYLVYAWLIVATVFLFLGWLLLLLGANPTSGFVGFVYRIAADFLEPFRGMFPPTQLSSTSYFSAAGLFAIVFYSIVAFFIHALIDFITLKLRKSEIELEQAEFEASRPLPPTPPRKPAPSTRQVR